MRLYRWQATFGSILKWLALLAVVVGVFLADRHGLLRGERQSSTVASERSMSRDRRAGDAIEYQVPLFEQVYPDRDNGHN